MANESVGKISLDLEVQSDINGQIKNLSQNLGSGIKQSVSGMFKNAFSGLGKQTKSNMGDVSKNIKSAMSDSTKVVKNTMAGINNNIKNTVRNTVSTAKKATGIKTTNTDSSTNDALTAKYNKQTEAVKKQQLAVDQLKVKYEQMLSGEIKPASLRNAESELKKLQSEIKATEQEYDKAFAKMQSAQINASMDKAARGSVTPTTASTIQKLEIELDRLGEKLGTSDDKAARLKNTISQIQMNPSTSAEASTLSGKLDLATSRLARLKAEAQSTESQINSTSKSARRFSTVLSGLKKGATVAGQGIKKLGGFFLSLLGRLKQVFTHSKKTQGAFNSLGKSSKGLGSNILRLGNMLKLMVARRALQAIVNGAKEGFQNLAQYSSDVNASLSSLMSALTRLKNAFATAFAPILNVVAPILTKLINMLADAATYIGMFFAALTGQSSFTKAVGVTQDYAASLSDASGSASDANAATQEYQKTLMGFDSINKLDSQSDSSSSSGSGGSGGGTSVSDMFETVEISGWASNLANIIKEAWANADFTEVGAMLGTKLNNALNSIDWVKIQATCDKIAKSVATFLNGFIETTDWTLVGNTLAQGINTVFRTANTFATNFHWGSFGKAVGDGINGAMTGLDWTDIKTSVSNIAKGLMETLNSFISTTDWGLVAKTLGECVNTVIEFLYTTVTTFDWIGLGSSIADFLNNAVTSIDWAKLGSTLSNAVKGILGTIKTAIAETDWFQLGRDLATAVGDFLSNIDWAGCISDFAFVFGQSLLLLPSLLSGFLIDAINAVNDYLWEKVEEMGGDLVLGVLWGILDALIGIGTWLWDNLVAPIIDGVKSMFGIHSPSTVFAEIGEWLIQGLLQGIENIWNTIVEFFSGALDSLKETISGAWEAVKTAATEKWESIKEALSTAWENIKTTVSEKFNAIKDSISTVWNNVKTTASSIWNGITSTLSTAWTNISNTVTSVFTGIKNTITNIFNGIWNTIRGVINSILGGIEGMANGVINGINTVIRALNKLNFDIPDWVPVFGGSSFGFNIGTLSNVSLPRLATGGIIDTPTLAMVGEDGQEAVVPLEKNTGWLDNVASMVAEKIGTSGGVSKSDMETFTSRLEVAIFAMVSALEKVGFYVDSEELARLVQKGMNKNNRRQNTVTVN